VHFLGVMIICKISIKNSLEVIFNTSENVYI